MSFSPPSQDWMVLQCSACATRMKVQRGVASASRLLCPHCRTPVPLQDEPEDLAAFQPAPLPTPEGARPVISQWESLVMEGTRFEAGPGTSPPVPPEEAGLHPVFDGSGPDDAEDLDETDDTEHPDDGAETPRHRRPRERRRVKLKRRRAKRPSPARYLELTDWDQKELTDLPEAEIAADIWAAPQLIPEEVAPVEQQNDYVVESVEDGEGQTKTTKKRVRRRRLLLGARLFFQRFTSISRYLTATLAVALAGVAIYGFYVFRQRYQAPPASAFTEPPIDRSVLTSYDAMGAEKAVRDFLAADGIEAKLALVRQPDRIRPLMKRWYRDERTPGPLTAGEPSMRDKWGGEPGGAGYFVMLAMPVNVPDPLNPGRTYEETTFFAVEEIRNGPASTYLVDWETSTGYQELPLETYKATMPPEPYPFRIYMKADNYYNHGFTELEWQCVALYYPGRDFHLYGYISRSTLEGRTLLPLVEEGRRAGIIAELVYPADAASRDQVVVKRMLHPSWYFAKPEDAAVMGDRNLLNQSN